MIINLSDHFSLFPFTGLLLLSFSFNDIIFSIITICHGDMTEKRGGENVVGISMFPIMMEF